MKTSSAAKGRIIDRKTATACAAINLAATPGLGTMMAGRFFAGAAQLLFSGAGFGLILWWFFHLFRAILNATEIGQHWLWQVGLILFTIGWLGSLWSSVNIFREAKTKTPPKLDGTSG